MLWPSIRQDLAFAAGSAEHLHRAVAAGGAVNEHFQHGEPGRPRCGDADFLDRLVLVIQPRDAVELHRRRHNEIEAAARGRPVRNRGENAAMTFGQRDGQKVSDSGTRMRTGPLARS